MRKKHTDKIRDNFRKTGSITFQGKKVDILIDKKTGEMKFQENGKDITDLDKLDAVYAYLKEANKEQ